MNKVCLVGRLTKDPELKTNESGFKYTSVTLAINNGKDKDGNKRQTDYPKIAVYEAQAENLAKYQKKGNLIAVEGRIKTRSWDKEDGTKGYETYVAADRVQFLSSKSESVPPMPDPDYVPHQSQETTENESTETAPDMFDEFSKEADLSGLNEVTLNPDDLPF